MIYDLGDPTRRRTIYADSGAIALAANRKDLDLDLYHGQMQEVATDKPGQLNRLFYEHDRIRIRDVARDFKRTDANSSSKGDREMSVCEMQRRLWQAEPYEPARGSTRSGEARAGAPPEALTTRPRRPASPSRAASAGCTAAGAVCCG